MTIAPFVRVFTRILLAIALITVVLPGHRARAAIAMNSQYFTTSDGVRLHYLEAGSRAQQTIVFVPGWTMPAWIWDRQINAFATSYHVVAFDPRGQGDSEIPRSGYDPVRRGQDIGELIAQFGRRPVLVVAWSLGVLDTLAYVKAAGDGHVAGLVLVDNSIGEEPAPPPPASGPRGVKPPPREVVMDRFVRSMFRTRQTEDWLDRLTETALRTPQPAAASLLAYPVPRSYWREAVYSTDKPILYIVRPRWMGQAENLVRQHPAAEMVVFANAGHALFVDDPVRFNAALGSFIHRKVWP